MGLRQACCVDGRCVLGHSLRMELNLRQACLIVRQAEDLGFVAWPAHVRKVAHEIRTDTAR